MEQAKKETAIGREGEREGGSFEVWPATTNQIPSGAIHAQIRIKRTHRNQQRRHKWQLEQLEMELEL